MLPRASFFRPSNAWQWLRSKLAPLPQIDPVLWQQTLGQYPFLAILELAEQAKLRVLCAVFLQRKEFTGAHGLEITDTMALAIAAQACLPLLYWGPPQRALNWYDDFVTIVVHPSEALARRTAMDAAGVVHHYREPLLGEAMQRGPVMLSWPAVQEAGQANAIGSVVIHEFVHKIDMQNGNAEGCPPLPKGFLGTHSAQAAQQAWRQAWAPAYEQFCDQVSLAERFGAPTPWLDAYAASAPEEFFAVACEAYFVQRPRFALEFPTLLPMLEALFRPPSASL